MFSDRWWIVKAAAALGLLAWLCQDTHRRLAALYPDVERVALFSDSLRGLKVHLWAKQVQKADATGFEITTKVGPMRVLTTAPPPIGEHVSVSARPVGPRTLQADALHINHGYEWKRPLNYVLSALTLIAYLWLIRKKFRWRIEEGVFRSKY